MDAAQNGQVSESAADIYEEFFVPCLFGDWAPRVVGAAQVARGDRVIDVACGTGVLARAALEAAGPDGDVVGLDLNPGMLAVARRVAPDIAWHEGRAEALPFEAGRFDAALSQFGLMFFEDRRAALLEMWRVLAPGGRLAVAVWGALEETPGYLAMVGLLDRLFGREAADALRAPYNLGSTAALRDVVDAARIPDVRIDTLPGEARFPSIDAWVHVDVRGWTLADMIDDDQYQTLRRAANAELAGFAGPDGSVAFPHGAHIVTATKP